MRLVACPACRTQYDVTTLEGPSLTCACGVEIQNRPLRAIEATVERCGSCGAAVESGAAVCRYCRSPIAREGASLSLICPLCFARNADAARFCTHCGTRFEPQAVVAGGDGLECPACEHALAARAIGGTLIHECPRCHGLWAGGPSFDLIVERAMAGARGEAASAGLGRGAVGCGAPSRPARDAEWKVAYRNCPVCRGPMHRKNYGRRSGVIVDWCAEHGTWLDADELGAIVAFILDGSLAGMERTGEPRPGAAEARALAEAERIMAGEKMAHAKRRARAAERPAVSGYSILEFLLSLVSD